MRFRYCSGQTKSVFGRVECSKGIVAAEVASEAAKEATKPTEIHAKWVWRDQAGLEVVRTCQRAILLAIIEGNIDGQPVRLLITLILRGCILVAI